jgi:hypothetical protein
LTQLSINAQADCRDEEFGDIIVKTDTGGAAPARHRHLGAGAVDYAALAAGQHAVAVPSLRTRLQRDSNLDDAGRCAT